MRENPAEPNARDSDTPQPPLDDIHGYLLRRVRQAADDYRAKLRDIATQTVDAIIDGLDAGLSRDQLIDELARGLEPGAFPKAPQ